MIKLSRRVIARYVCEQLVAGAKPVEIAHQALAELEQSGRRNQWQMLIDDVALELEQRGLLARARVNTAHELSAELRQRLETFVKSLSNAQETELSFATDEQLIGGVRIETARAVIDTTIKRQLLNLRKA